NGLKTLTWIMMILILISAASCKGKGKGGVQQFQTSVESSWNGAMIKGKVKNLNDAHISYVEVQYDLLDDKHFAVGSVSAKNDNGIEPNGEWEFEIPAAAVRARSTLLRQTIVR